MAGFQVKMLFGHTRFSREDHSSHGRRYLRMFLYI